MTPDKSSTLQKHFGPYGIFLMIVEKGIVVVENQEWKNRRRILSKVFNYDFIVSQIPNIISIADKIFDQFEEKYWSKHPEKR